MTRLEEMRGLSEESRMKVHSFDVLENGPDPSEFTIAVNVVNSFYERLSELIELRKNSGRIEFNKAESLEIMVDQKTGMIYELVLIPSEITREIGWTIAKQGIKPEGGVSEWIGLSQRERREKWTELMSGVEAIYYKDHGYGAGIPAEQPIIDALAKGEMTGEQNQSLQLSQKEMVVMLMTKGSGGTHLNKTEQNTREDKPKYDMDATYAQLAEALLHLDNKITQDLLLYYQSLKGIKKLEQTVEKRNEIFGNKNYTKELINLAELLSGTWMSNRVAGVDGHSMGGWEVIRAYLGNAVGRFTDGMLKYADQLGKTASDQRTVAEKGMEILTSRLKQMPFGEQILADAQFLHDEWPRVIAGFQGEKSGLSVEGKGEFLKDIAAVKMNNLQNYPLPNERDGDNIRRYLINILQNKFPNAIWEAETPLMRGKEAKGIFRNSNHVHAFLIDPLRAAGLRLLLQVNKINKEAGQATFGIGNKLKIVDSSLNDFVAKNAFGRFLVKATHFVGLHREVGGVLMDDQVLQEANVVVGDPTIKLFNVKEVVKMVGANFAGLISNLKIIAGGKDTVLNHKDMRVGAMAMTDTIDQQMEKLYREHPEAGHYLTKEAIAEIWSDMMGRATAIMYHRDKLTELIATGYFSKVQTPV